jgi:hypothetical protein
MIKRVCLEKSRVGLKVVVQGGQVLKVGVAFIVGADGHRFDQPSDNVCQVAVRINFVKKIGEIRNRMRYFVCTKTAKAHSPL